MKKDIIEAIASGYVDNIKIIKQDVKGRTVCTTLIGYVNPDAVKSVISRKVERVRETKRKEFKELLSNNRIKILNYYRHDKRKADIFDKVAAKNVYSSGRFLTILYQAKELIRDDRIADTSVPILIDCFDKSGNPMFGTSVSVPSHGVVYEGEVRQTLIELPLGTVSYEIRLRQ